MRQVYDDSVEADGRVNALCPNHDFAHADHTDSTALLTPETNINALAAWIKSRRLNGLGGAVLLVSKTDGRHGRYSLDRITVI